jgi:response regulator of citrate/malate metabolism
MNGSFLIVDDDPIHNFLCEDLVRSMDIQWEIILADSGSKAIEIIQNRLMKGLKCPEIILLDMYMPMMDGYDFLTLLENMENVNRAELTIGIQSSSKRKDFLKPGVHPLIDFYFVKPLTEDNIMALYEKYKNKRMG